MTESFTQFAEALAMDWRSESKSLAKTDRMAELAAPAFAEKFSRSRNLELLACGMDRCVIALDKHWVIKLPILELGRQANIWEADNYAKMPAQAHEWFAKVEQSHPDGHWLIMERLTPVHGDDLDDEFYEQLSDLRFEIDDLNEGNVGWRGDDLVILDYGEPLFFKNPTEDLAALKRRLMR